MRPDEFRALLRWRPFEPFTIYLSTGARFEVRDAKLAVVGRSIVWLEQGLPGHPIPIAVRRVASPCCTLSGLSSWKMQNGTVSISPKFTQENLSKPGSLKKNYGGVTVEKKRRPIERKE